MPERMGRLRAHDPSIEEKSCVPYAVRERSVRHVVGSRRSGDA
jgi:hypothetical protein